MSNLSRTPFARTITGTVAIALAFSGGVVAADVSAAVEPRPGESAIQAQEPAPEVSDRKLGVDRAQDKKIKDAIRDRQFDAVRSGAQHNRSKAFSVVIKQDSPARAGGQGTAFVSFPRSGTGAASAMAVKIGAGRKLSVVKAKGKGWTCTVASGAASCGLPRSLRAGKTPPRIAVTIAAASKAKSAKITAKASWSVNRRVKASVQKSNAAATLQVNDRLALRVATPAVRKIIAGEDPASRQIVLSGDLSTPGQAATLKWKGSKGVTWLTSKSVTTAGGQIGATAQLPRVKKKTTIKLTATAASQGGKVKRTIKVTLLPPAPKMLKPRLASFARAFKAAASTGKRPVNTRGQFLLPLPANVGPEGLHLTSVLLGFSSLGSGNICKPATRSAASTRDLIQTRDALSDLGLSVDATYSITATASILGTDVSLSGQFDSNGYCFTGEMPTVALGSGGPVLTNSRIGYTSYPATIEYAGGATMALESGQLNIQSTMTLPSAAADQLPGLGGDLTFEGTFTGSTAGLGLDGSLSYTIDSVPVSTSNGTTLSVGGSTKLSVSFTPGQTAKIAVSVGGQLSTTAAADGSVAASVTPLSVALSFDVITGRFAISGGVDASSGQSVANAFGVSGLSVSRLVVAGGIGATQAIAISASASLPESWGSAVGLKPGAPVTVALQLTTGTDSCLKLSVGPGTGGKTALDVANAGVVVAKSASIAIAPLGCTFDKPSGGSFVIQPGYGLAFDGAIMGTPVTVAAQTQLPSAANPSFVLSSSLALGAIQLGPIGISNTTISMSINTATQQSSFVIKGGIDVMGSTASIDAMFSSNSSQVTLKAQSQSNVSIAGINANGTLKLDLAAATGTGIFQQASANWSGSVDALGAQIGLSGNLAYSNGALASLTMATSVSLTVAGTSANGTLTVTYTTNNGGSPRWFKGNVQGSYPVLWWTENFNFDLWNVQV